MELRSSLVLIQHYQTIRNNHRYQNYAIALKSRLSLLRLKVARLPGTPDPEALAQVRSACWEMAAELSAAKDLTQRAAGSCQEDDLPKRQVWQFVLACDPSFGIVPAYLSSQFADGANVGTCRPPVLSTLERLDRALACITEA